MTRGSRERLLRDVYVVVALVFVSLRLLSVAPWDQSVDAFAYWSTRSGDLYTGTTGSIGSFLYAPAFAQAITPLTWLPWPIFNAIWTGCGFFLLWWLTGRWALLMLLFLPVSFEIISGNVHLLLAAVIVAGFRYPSAWALVLLTKVTPGVGLLWFLVRREWRPLALGIMSTVVIIVLSVLIDLQLWLNWMRLLANDAGQPLVTTGWSLPIPLLPRLVVAGLVVGWGAVNDRYWTVPIAVTVALPVVWLNSLAILVAVVPIVQAMPAASQGDMGRASAASRVVRSRLGHA